MTEPEILFDTLSGPHGAIGLITLNRPQLLNALNEAMCIALYEQLNAWAQTSTIKAVVIRGAGERAFCAGGDIRSLYELRSQPIPEKPFFWHEYRLNRCIFHFPKPYIALLDGVTMGGGVGLSMNGALRVGTEKLKFAMPETGIGFFPDVGGSYFLPRCPGKTGWYLALSGAAIDVADAYAIGAVNIHTKHEYLSPLLDALVTAPWSNAEPLLHTARNILDTFATPPPPSQLQTHRQIIDRCFAQASVETILAQLEQSENTWANETAKLLQTRSPTSLKVTFEQLTRGAQLDFDECIRMEYRIALQFLHTPDFYEGVRAAIINKDRHPQWQPKTLAEVSEDKIAAFFVDRQELVFE
jgi:enoyl-CoA hydratase